MSVFGWTPSSMMSWRELTPRPRAQHPIFIPEMSKVFDASKVWVTADLRGIAYDKLGRDHFHHIFGFLQRMKIPLKRFPNLVAEAKRRDLLV